MLTQRILLTAALLSTLAWPAVAQDQRCAPIDQVAAKLAAEYQETRIQQGIVGEGRAMLVVFASKDGATWTAVMLRPDGVACLAAMGTDWQTRSDPAPVQETPL